jgi:hypothetical protein
MSTQLFLSPQIFDPTTGIRVPKYQSLLTNYVCIPFGIEGLCLIAAAPNSSLSAESDVYSFPINLSDTLAVSDVTAIQTYFNGVNIPNSFVVAGMTFQTVAALVARIFLMAQRNTGLTGDGIFTTETTASLATAAASVAAGHGTPVAPIRVGIAPTLTAELTTLPTLATQLTAVATSFGLNEPSSSFTLDSALYFLASQYTNAVDLGGLTL